MKYAKKFLASLSHDKETGSSSWRTRLVALRTGKGSPGHAIGLLRIGAVGEVVLAQCVGPLERLAAPMTEERPGAAVHVGSVAHQVLLAVRLVAALGALVQGPLRGGTVAGVPLPVSCQEEGTRGAVAAVGALHRLGRGASSS